jgi:hypothetical protein
MQNFAHEIYLEEPDYHTAKHLSDSTDLFSSVYSIHS